MDYRLLLARVKNYYIGNKLLTYIITVSAIGLLILFNCFNILRLGKGAGVLAIDIKTEAGVKDHGLVVHRISFNDKLIRIEDMDNGLRISDTYIKKIVVTVPSDKSHALQSITVRLGNKTATYTGAQVKNTWPVSDILDDKPGVTIYELPPDIRLRSSGVPKFNTLINWKGDVQVVLLALFYSIGILLALLAACYALSLLVIVLNKKKRLALIIAAVVLFAFIMVSLTLTLLKTGRISYPLDDTFIHMSIAKNFSQHGVWGITRHEFSSTSSSLLYTLILSFCYLIVKPNLVIPILVNVIFVGALLVLCYTILEKNKLNGNGIALTLLAVIFFTPLLYTTLLGMEHILHILLSLFFIYLSATMLERNDKSLKHDVILLITGMLLISTRYESMFMVCIVCALFLFRGRWIFALILGVVSFLPVGLYGLYAINHGAYFFPNSLMIKGETSFSFKRPFLLLYDVPWLCNILLGSVVLSLFTISRDKHFRDKYVGMTTIFALAVLAHLEFVGVKGFFRYDGYLMVIGIIIFALHLSRIIKRYPLIPILSTTHKLILIPLIILIMIFFHPLVRRASEALRKTHVAMVNIYDQQQQMGLFLQKYYNSATVAANDIGAITYYTDITLVDIIGLGNNTIARQKRQNTLDYKKIITDNNVPLIIIYDYCVPHWIRKEWVKVGDWQIATPYTAGHDIVTFFAVDNREALTLKNNMRAFESELPATVKVRYDN